MSALKFNPFHLLKNSSTRESIVDSAIDTIRDLPADRNFIIRVMEGKEARNKIQNALYHVCIK